MPAYKLKITSAWKETLALFADKGATEYYDYKFKNITTRYLVVKSYEKIEELVGKFVLCTIGREKLKGRQDPNKDAESRLVLSFKDIKNAYDPAGLEEIKINPADKDIRKRIMGETFIKMRKEN